MKQKKRVKTWKTIISIIAILWLVSTCLGDNEKPKSDADFYEEYQEEERGNTVLYNPAKATPFMHEIIAACPGIEWKPIQGMTRAGRERMPREAALCGCCLITSKIGSAYYYMDFFHDYKFDSKPEHMWAIVRKIQYVLDHYEECRKDFNMFRILLNDDRKKMEKQCTDVVMALREVI